MINNELKLSDLNDSQLLIVERYVGESTKHNYLKVIDVISKYDFLMQDPQIYNCKEKIKISLAIEEKMKFNLRSVIESIGEDAYEDWDNQVYDDLMSQPETEAFLNKLKQVFNAYPVYYSGHNVEIDVWPVDKI